MSDESEGDFILASFYRFCHRDRLVSAARLVSDDCIYWYLFYMAGGELFYWEGL